MSADSAAIRLSLVIQTPEAASPSPLSLLSGTFDERLSKAAAMGFDGVELLPAAPGALDAQAIGYSLRQVGLEPAAVGSALMGLAGRTLVQADTAEAANARRWLHEAITFAGGVGAPLVTIGGFRGAVASVDGGPELLADVLRVAAEHARSCGVRLVLEPLNRYENDFINRAGDALAFLEKVDHASIGLLLDTCHMNIDESSWSEPFRQVMRAGKLWHLHAADNNRLAPGRGLIDFRRIIRLLKQIGYAGYLSAEILALPDPDLAASETLNHLRCLIAEDEQDCNH